MSWRSIAHMSVAGLLLAAVGLAFAAPGAGQATQPAQPGLMDAWANFILAPKVWKGQVVPEPDAGERASGGTWLDSDELPLRVHAPVGTSRLQLTAARGALEQAYRTLAASGWPLPFADGGRGGSLAFDLYLDPAARAPAYAASEQPIAWLDFDSAGTYAVVDAGLPRRDLPACVMSALVQAALHGRDPAEAESMLRATGDFAAWLFLGEYGCAGSMLAAQHAPELGFLQRDPDSGARGAAFLAMLSERHDGGTGRFIEAAWQLTRQRSRGLVKPGILRSSPDLWEALAASLHAAGEDWSDDVEELVAARLFAGDARARAAASYRVFAALPNGAQLPMQADWTYAQLPKRFRSADDGIPPLGSVYLRVRTPNVTEGQELRVWLRGELGPRWSLIAIRLGASGTEVGRVKSPLRTMPDSYVPLLLTSDTAEVVLAVTYITVKTPDADAPPALPHAFELVVDRSPAP